MGALKHGSNMCVAFGALGASDTSRDLSTLFSDNFFPRALIEGKGKIFEQEVWSKLLRPEKGDCKPNEFVIDGNFQVLLLECFINVGGATFKRLNLDIVLRKILSIALTLR